MNTKNVLIGGFVSGICYFFLGWLIYGILLMDYMTQVSPQIEGLNRPETDFVWWALILSNIVSGIFMAFVFDLGNIKGWMSGLRTGAIIGFLISVSFDLSFYSMTYMISQQGMIADVAAGTVMSGIVGAILGMVMQKMNK